ncbi:hypothetical protein [Leptospira stimsonii]|uniref:Cys-rich protein n=1 Tax=Leptospira stimsonii TaxID=2202203 RepID=A0A4R9LA06_9LEPT|nr:hypothetical protein [Leptospira stimsonii]RHX83831.1 hypothetical protein DLM78_20310 [Leptospira stimsonii]RHX87131.1 hypothetical protein DLM75_19095 [Leptospira stimsonii]TGK18427.1 hypothetical protein EHO98_12505 [Leptospira stimsonii]TGM21933.1 hypothetical protein EHQ90_02020 [Leptospira stimsonii]
MNLLKTALIVGLCFLPLLSEYAQPNGAHRDNCRAERETYCKDVRPGPEGHRCLKENESKLSASCKSHLAEMETRHKAMKEACAVDEEKFCKDSTRENGGPMRCLRSHESELSAKCRDALPPPPPDKR